MRDSVKPLISIVTLVYNNAERVLFGLESLRSQIFNEYEHIIIDDCSSDNSVYSIQNWIDENNHSCRFLKHSVNLGINRSLNEFIGMASGKYWAIIGDDIWSPEHLKHNIDLLENETNRYAKLVYSPCDVVGPDLIKSDVWSPQKRLFDRGASVNFVNGLFPPGQKVHLIPGKEFQKALFYCNVFHPVSALISIAATKDVGEFDESLEFEDWDLAFRYSEKYDVLFSNHISVKYVLHGSNYTLSNKLKLHFGKLKTLLKHRSKAKDENIKAILRDSIKKSTIDVMRSSEKFGIKSMILSYLLLLRLSIKSALYFHIFSLRLLKRIAKNILVLAGLKK